MHDTQTLKNTFIPFRVKYAGLIADCTSSAAAGGTACTSDLTGRTELLRLIDTARRDGRVARATGVVDDDALFEINAMSVRMTQLTDETTILTCPIHMITSIGHIHDDNTHILTLRIGDVHGPNSDVSDLCVMYAANEPIAVAICNTLDRCFHIVFADIATAAMHTAHERRAVVARSPTNTSPTARTDNQSTYVQRALVLDIFSASSAFANVATRQYSTSNESEKSYTEMTNEYMTLLFAVLTADEIREFYGLFKLWLGGARPLDEVAQKMLELFGQERKHLLARMRPFIKPIEKQDFEWFLEQNGISDNAGSSLPSWSPQSDMTSVSRAIELNTDLLLTMTPPTPMHKPLPDST